MTKLLSILALSFALLSGCSQPNPKPQGMMLVRTADVWYGATDEGVGVCELYADTKTGQAIIWHDGFKRDNDCWESIGKTLIDEYKVQKKLIEAGAK